MNQKTEYLFSVGIRDKKLGTRMDLYVWAETLDEASEKLHGTLIGHDCEYEWTGTSGAYQGKRAISREVTVEA